MSTATRRIKPSILFPFDDVMFTPYVYSTCLFHFKSFERTIRRSFVVLVTSTENAKKLILIMKRLTVSKCVNNTTFAKIKFYLPSRTPWNKIVKIRL